MSKDKVLNFLQTAKIPLSLGAALILVITASSFGAFAKTADGLSDEIFRLHILANSDNEYDQSLKLAVRDRILENSGELFGQADDSLAAAAMAEQKLGEIEQIARREVLSQGYDYPVRAELTKMYFPTREYEKYTIPAGKYDALRVTIGEGKGHNWWCVLYPPLCLPAAESEETLEAFNGDELEIIQNGEKYKVKFMAVELIEKFKEWLEK